MPIIFIGQIGKKTVKLGKTNLGSLNKCPPTKLALLYECGAQEKHGIDGGIDGDL